MNRIFASLILVCAIFILAPVAAHAVTIAWSTVGNPGNANDPANGNGAGSEGHYGAVAYSYKIGTFDVTNSQYAEFLNTKDPTGTSTLGLWNGSMANAAYGGISFNSGEAIGSKYVLTAGRQNHPVNYVTWYDAVRFVNWLNNGQGDGDTESGAYTLLGGTPTPSNHDSVRRNAGATVFLPSENEWYKAAFYNLATDSYFKYATSSNSIPIRSGPTALANHANFDLIVGNPTDVGAYTGTASPYGAFDMNGNVFQWNEDLLDVWNGLARGLRGGSFTNGQTSLPSSSHGAYQPWDESYGVGFRVAIVPEPSTLYLAALGILGLLIAVCRGSIRVCLICSAIRGLAVAWLVLLGFPATLHAAPILWSVGSGGNGHYYESILNPINWEAAKSAANAQLFLGKNGHLATITSQAENNFLAGNFADSYFLGGFQPAGSAEPAGSWAWVTGETWNYTNWAAGEPNNSSGNEKYLEFFITGPKWNDTSILANRNYIVEYDIPEPGTLALAVVGAFGLLIAARRRR